MSFATRYALLRGGAAWAASSLHQLVIDHGGDVILARASAAERHAPAGALVAGPLDAGEESSWMRVALDVEVPASTRVRLELAAARSDAPAPADYVPVPGHDVWLPSVLPVTRDGTSDPERLRYLWIRVHLETLDVTRSPRLLQVRAQTAGEDYLSQLPAVFAREDAGQAHYLERLLELVGSTFGDWERGRQDLARRLDPYWARTEDLPWLAEWLGWDHLPRLPADRLRAVVDRLAELNELRGTREGLQRIIRAFTGIEVSIVEQFCKRPMWVLGDGELGIATGLSAPADGLVVPGDADLCDDEDAVMVVGEAVVGHQAPLEREHLGAPVFDEDAHRFTVFVPPGAACSAEARASLRRIIDAEKPAHADYHLCFLERVQVGTHLTIGVDAYVGQAYGPEPLGTARLGLGTFVAEPAGRIRIGSTDHLREGASLK